ncbi:helix-turn-helix domain-containing protein [Pseudomonas sp. Leaf127]|uniref:helix-turn-helix domain-containing protein n=1 Tax=Pseudomonas sp. Leaf127 TaxID=1736267 RepID=UPI0009E844A2|nr:helix-turn-helix transcriptional regulator [Pseudomonas sp. Leaf127]
MRKLFLSNFALRESHPQNRVMNIGAAIRKVRLEKGLTLEAVALDAGTYAGNLSKVERAQQLPSLDLLHKLSEALGTKTSALYAVAESESDSGSGVVSEPSPEQGNEVILVRRHFQALTPRNRKLAIEFLKLLGQSQDDI